MPPSLLTQLQQFRTTRISLARAKSMREQRPRTSILLAQCHRPLQPMHRKMTLRINRRRNTKRLARTTPSLSRQMKPRYHCLIILRKRRQRQRITVQCLSLNLQHSKRYQRQRKIMAQIRILINQFPCLSLILSANSPVLRLAKNKARQWLLLGPKKVRLHKLRKMTTFHPSLV